MSVSTLDDAVLTRRSSASIDELFSPLARAEGEPSAQAGPRDLIAILRRRSRLIVALVVGGVSLALLATLVLPKSYKAQATIIFEPADANLLEEQPGQPTFQAIKTKMDTESDLMLSRALGARVVDEMGLIAEPDFNTYLQRTVPDGERTVMGRAKDALSSFGRALGALLPDGSWVKASLIEPPDATPAPLPSEKVQKDRAITTLLSRLTVTRSGDSLAMTVSAADDRPDRAAKIADAATQLFVQWSRERRRENIKSGVNFLRDQGGELASRIATIEGRAAEYQDQNNVSTDARDDLLRFAIQQTNEQLSVARSDLTRAKARVAQIQHTASGESARVDQSLSSEFLTSLRNDEATQLRDLAQIARNHGANHPLMQEADRKIASVRSLIVEETRRIVAGLEDEVPIAESRVRDFEESLANASKRLRQRSLAEISLREINRDLATEQKLHDVVTARLGKLDPYAKVAQPDARVVSSSEVPTEPSFPRWRVMLGGGFALSLVIGVLLAVTLEMFDRRIKNVQQVRQILKAPLLSEIPPMPRRFRNRLGGVLDHVAGRIPSRFSEEMWVIYRACRRAVGAGKAPVLLVASAPPFGAGVSVALGVAVAAAKDGARTAFFSLDPNAQSLLPSASGSPQPLSEYLAGRCGMEDVVSAVPDLPDMDVLLSHANSDRDGAIGPEQIRWLLDELRLRYDVVVVDAPVALADISGTALASTADAVVFVVAWNLTTEQAVIRTAGLLRLEDAPLVGFVMNGSDEASGREHIFRRARPNRQGPLGQAA